MSEQQSIGRVSTAERREKEKIDIEKAGRGVTVTDDDEASDVFASFVEGEAGHDIKLRTMSWQKTAVLLFGKPPLCLSSSTSVSLKKCENDAGEYVWHVASSRLLSRCPLTRMSY
jgi:hypothetical protein